MQNEGAKSSRIFVRILLKLKTEKNKKSVEQKALQHAADGRHSVKE